MKSMKQMYFLSKVEKIKNDFADYIEERDFKMPLDVGKYPRIIRIKSGLSQKDVAFILSTQQPTISKFENHKIDDELIKAFYLFLKTKVNEDKWK